MITYFCHFGDGKSGILLDHRIFKNGKLISFFAENLIPENYSHFLNKILIRIFVDGTIKQYPQINSGSEIFSIKDKCVAVNFHLTFFEIEKMVEDDVDRFIISSTLYAIGIAGRILKDRGIQFKEDQLAKDVLRLFNKKNMVLIE